MKARVHVTLKNGVLDPQGKAIGHSLNRLGFPEVGDVRQGKFIELELAETDKAKAKARLEEMCRKLLANTVIENYSIEIGETRARPADEGRRSSSSPAPIARATWRRRSSWSPAASPQMVWHGDGDFEKTDLIVVPGGFSYGDYLRCGAMAAQSPVMAEVKRRAAQGVPVLGICNGFQIVTEAGLLPGTLMRNSHLKFVCSDVHLKVETSQSLFTNRYQAGQVIKVPGGACRGQLFRRRRHAEEARGSRPDRLPLLRA